VLRTNAASSAKKLSVQVLCTGAALMREHALPAFVRTLNARRLSSFSALIECDLKFTCSEQSTLVVSLQEQEFARLPLWVNPVQHLSNFSVFPNDKIYFE
jgi:hypothetical protein